MKKSTKTAIIFLAVILIIAALVAIFMPSIKAIASGSQLHTTAELQQNYNKGYEDASKNEEYLKNLVGSQRNTINELLSDNAELNEENDRLNKFIKDHSCRVTFVQNIPDLDGNSNFIKLVWVLKGLALDEADMPENPERNSYSFVGWSLDGENAVNLETQTFSSDTLVYALWQEKNVETTLKLNGGSVKVNNQSYTSDAALIFGYDEKLTLADASSEGFELYTYYVTLKKEDGTRIGGKKFKSINHSTKELYEEIYTDRDEYGEISPEALKMEIEMFWSPVIEDIETATPDELKVLIAIETGTNGYINEYSANNVNMMTNVSNEDFVTNYYLTITGESASTDTLEVIEKKIIRQVSQNHLGYKVTLPSTDLSTFYRTLYKILTNQTETLTPDTSEEYTVKYYVEQTEGTTTKYFLFKTETYAEGDSLDYIPPQKTGYEFVCWQVDGQKVETCTGDMSVYAFYRKLQSSGEGSF